MFMRFTLLALVAAATALPATEKQYPEPITSISKDDFVSPWFSFPSFSTLFGPLFKLIPSFAEIGPRIEADDDKFTIVMDGLKNYKKDDIKIKIKGSFIFIQGSHEVKQDDHDLFASQFFHTYSLPENASSADVTATISSDGVLLVTAPLNGPADKTKEGDREVPIVETGVPYEEKDVKEEQTTAAAVTAAPTTASEDRKEPTTPEDTTDKDNDIPHGNEISP